MSHNFAPRSYKMRSDLQKLASSHNWEIYKIKGMRNQFNWIRDRCSTLTPESKKDINQIIDDIDQLLTSMKLRNDQEPMENSYGPIRQPILLED